MDLPDAQGSSHATEKQGKFGIQEIFLPVETGILQIKKEEFGILGFGIRNPRRRIDYRRQSLIPYMGRQGDALNLDARRNWNSLMTLFIWAALLAIKTALGEISLR